MSIFFAGGATQFGAAASTGTTPSNFSQPSSTGAAGAQRSPTETQTPGLAEWLQSESARQLAGRWVMLSDNFEVIDSAVSPSELLGKHPDAMSPLVVFVQPHGVQLAV